MTAENIDAVDGDKHRAPDVVVVGQHDARVQAPGSPGQFPCHHMSGVSILKVSSCGATGNLNPISGRIKA